MSTTSTADRFTALPDEQAIIATVVALEEHGFSAEVAAALERLIERMRELDGLWIASLDEVAAYAGSLNLPARQLSPPQLPPA